MIKGFEGVTYDLTEEELAMVDSFVVAFKKYSKANPIKAPVIIKKFNKAMEDSGQKTKLTEPRLRKIVNYIRSNGIIPLIATSAGYYVDYKQTEIKSQIESLEARARSILQCAGGLQSIINEGRSKI